MKKRHILLGVISAGALIGGVSFGVASNVKSYNAIAKCEAILKEETQEEQIKDLKAKILEIANNELVRSIVSYTTALSGVLGFIITFIKYKKYKSISSTEIAELVSKVTSESVSSKYEELEKSVVNELKEKFADVEEAINVLQKVLILAQDKTAKGKAALFDYLDTKLNENPNTDESVKETLEEVKKENEETIEKQEETLSKVDGDYVPVE